MKLCPACQDDTLTLDDFYKNKAQPDGFDHLCKSCRKGVSQERRAVRRASACMWIWIYGAWQQSHKATEVWCKAAGYPYHFGAKPDAPPGAIREA